MTSTRTSRIVVLAFGLALLPAGPLAADDSGQTQRGTPPAPRRGSAIGAQGFGSFGFTVPLASDSLTTVGLEDRPQEVGGGGQVTGLWRGLFVQVAASRWKEAGSRVFVDSRGNRFDLGIPLSVEAAHVDVGAGWRFERWRRDGSLSPVVPYVGGGIGVLDYTETSSFAQEGENVSERATTYSVFGGVETRIAPWIGIAADVRYRFVDGILGVDASLRCAEMTRSPDRRRPYACCSAGSARNGVPRRPRGVELPAWRPVRRRQSRQSRRVRQLHRL